MADVDAMACDVRANGNMNSHRWKQVASYPSGTETTIYVGGVLEKLTVASGTAYRHYIGAGSAQVIYTRWSTGSENTKYLTADHLNSSSVLMDASGNTLVGMSFAAYGARRGGAWSGAPSSGDWSQINNATRHGYTGHEHLDNVNLIHMNGRVFEPALGRFLSADPFMPGMLGSQAGNRLAYVGNQPLTLIDPSGFDAKDATETTPRKLPQCPYQIPGIEVDCPYQYGWRWDRDPFDLWFEREMLVEGWVRYMDATGGGANRQPPLPRPNSPPPPTNPPTGPAVDSPVVPQGELRCSGPKLAAAATMIDMASGGFIDTLFEQDMLLNFLGHGPNAQLSAEQMSTIRTAVSADLARSASGVNWINLVGPPTPTSTEGVVTRPIYLGKWSDSEFDGSLGTVTGTFQGNRLLGISDRFNYDPRPWGARGGYLFSVEVGVRTAGTIADSMCGSPPGFMITGH